MLIFSTGCEQEKHDDMKWGRKKPQQDGTRLHHDQPLALDGLALRVAAAHRKQTVIARATAPASTAEAQGQMMPTRDTKACRFLSPAIPPDTNKQNHTLKSNISPH